MNVLFLTIFGLNNIDDHSIYTDLLREFCKNGHNVYAVSPNERRSGRDTEIITRKGVNILKVKIGNITKCGLIEKGISTVMIESQYKRAIKKYLSDVKFDLVLYSTPPITLVNVIKYVKERDGAKTYLLLKDIFPQNAVDLGMMNKGILYSYFRNKEKKLYALSDRIGCMSEANCQYVLEHNREVSPNRVEVCPNSIEVRDYSLTPEEKRAMREKYSIPQDKKVFVYGGNLGKPQGVPFIIECMKSQKNNPDAYFMIVGDGTEFHRLEAYVNEFNPQNVKLMKLLPKEDYDRMIAACDVGLIFLDNRFTIPNFPSRLLAYMQARLPVLACTDKSSDVGSVIESGGFGWSCLSDNVLAFSDLVDTITKTDLSDMRNNAAAYLEEHYSVAGTYKIIANTFE